MRKSLFISIVVFIVVGILLNLFIKNPTFKTLEEQARFEIKTEQIGAADRTLFQLVNEDSFNIDKHYQFISIHFEPYDGQINDDTVRAFYHSFTRSDNHEIVDIGFYGKGLIGVSTGKYKEAIQAYLKVNNKELKYLNNSLGYAYSQIDSLEQAEEYFRKEIATNGNLSGAYRNLIYLLYEQNRMDEVTSYINHPIAKDYFPPHLEQYIYFTTFQPLKYSISRLKYTFSNLNLWGFIAALLITGSWIMYLRKVDNFEPEKWIHIIVTVLLGMLFSFITFPLSDASNILFGFELNGGLLNDFLYSVIGIGAIEELVKIIPLLILMRFTKIINEPFDYILFASLSALGFAFVENLIYFHEDSLHIIHGRAMIAVVSHMFDSSIIAYGIILNKYKWHKNPYLVFILFFILAAIAHGFYDFWLINETASQFSILTLIFFIYSLNVWNSFKNNALNHSNFFDMEKIIDNEKLQDYLMYSMVGILLFEYTVLCIKNGPSLANIDLYSTLVSGSYLIFFLTSSLSTFDLNEGVWSPIKLSRKNRESYTDALLSPKYLHIVNEPVFLTLDANGNNIDGLLPNRGLVLRRLVVSREVDWYLVLLVDLNPTEPYLFPNQILIRTKNRSELIKKGQNQTLAIYRIPRDIDFDAKNLKRTDFKFAGWAVLE